MYTTKIATKNTVLISGKILCLYHTNKDYLLIRIEAEGDRPSVFVPDKELAEKIETEYRVVLTAKWTPNVLTVNYYSNYADKAFSGSLNAVGASKNVLVRTAAFKYGEAYSDGLHNYSATNASTYLGRTGYTATGKWKSEHGQLVGENTGYSTAQALAKALGVDLSTGSKSVKVYAQWTINKYTVTYNANGGTGAPGNQTKTYGVALTLSSTKPTRTGYTFNGWNTKSDGSGTNYTSCGSYTGNANLTLYAKWTPNKYTVTYNANGGTGAPGNQTKTYGVAITLSSTKPTRTGYTFNGWNTKSDGSGTNYASGGSYTGNANLTLYAKWTPYELTIQYNSNGAPSKGHTVDNNVFNINSNGYATKNGAIYEKKVKYNNKIDATNGLADYTTFGMYKTGYTFVGWLPKSTKIMYV